MSKLRPIDLQVQTRIARPGELIIPIRKHKAAQAPVGEILITIGQNSINLTEHGVDTLAGVPYGSIDDLSGWIPSDLFQITCDTATGALVLAFSTIQQPVAGPLLFKDSLDLNTATLIATGTTYEDANEPARSGLWAANDGNQVQIILRDNSP